MTMRFISRYRLALLGLLGMFLAIGSSRSQTKSTRPQLLDHSRYKVVACRDSGDLMNDVLTHPGTIHEEEHKAALKTDCDLVLIAAGTPVLYMGHDYLGRHLVLVKAPF